MKCTPFRRRARRSAAIAVEFALVASFLATLFLMAVDFSRIFYYQTILNQCARNGAIFGANLRSYQETTWVSPYNTGTPSTANIQAVTITDGANLSPALTTSDVTVANANGSDGNAGVQVTISYTYTSLTSFPVFGRSFNLTAKASMRVAQ